MTRWRRRRRRALFALLAVAVLVSGALVWARAVANTRLETELDLVNASGGPAALADAAPPPVPAGENAAILLTEAFAAFEDEPPGKEAWEPFRRFYDDPWGMDPETKAAIAAWVARNEPALALVERALTRPACRFEFDWSSAIDMKFEPLVGLQLTSRLLKARAVLQAQRGDFDAALASCRQALECAELGCRDPLLILLLVRMGFEAVALRTANEILARGVPSEEPLTALAAAVNAARYEGDLQRTLRVERAFGSSWMVALEDDPGAADSMKVLSWDTTDSTQDVLGWIMPTTMARLDHARYLKLMRRVLELSQCPYQEARAGWEAFDAELAQRPWYDRMGSGALSLFHVVARKLEIHRVRLDLARLGLAVESRARAAGQPPAVLESIPVDRFGSGTYVYRVLGGGGYLLYSVGPNGVDDGGTEDEEDPEKRDLVWRRPAR